MILCDNDGRKIAWGKTVRYLLFLAAHHTARDMILTTDDGDPLVRCIVGDIMPRLIQKVLHDH